MRDGSGPWPQILRAFGVWDRGGWTPEKSPLEYLDSLGFLTRRPPPLLVHNGEGFRLERFPLGTRVSVTFSSPNGGAEMTLEGEVRYQCYINFARADASRSGMRGIGLKFVSAQSPQKGARGSIH